jgi:hypothetical protein
MTRVLAITALLLALLIACTSCMDEEPAEVSVQTSQAGQPVNVNVMIFNEKGVQIQEAGTERGFVIVKSLKPGTYFLKFKAKSESGELYPATRKISLSGGDSHVEQVDVDDASKNPPDFPGAAAPPA